MALQWLPDRSPTALQHFSNSSPSIFQQLSINFQTIILSQFLRYITWFKSQDLPFNGENVGLRLPYISRILLLYYYLFDQTNPSAISFLPRAYIFCYILWKKTGYRGFPSTYLDGSLGIFKDTKHEACVAGVEWTFTL